MAELTLTRVKPLRLLTTAVCNPALQFDIDTHDQMLSSASR